MYETRYNEPETQCLYTHTCSLIAEKKEINKKKGIKKGFSLAEMMIVMLIISIVLAASGPMLAKREEKILTGSVPAGTIITYAGSITMLKPPPTGWLLCDGRAVSRADYSPLFNAIGTIYGTGNGSTTFNLPDLRGRATIGMDNLGGTSANVITDAHADTLGGKSGEEFHTLSTAEMPSHNHDNGSGCMNENGSHDHSITDNGHYHASPTWNGHVGSYEVPTSPSCAGGTCYEHDYVGGAPTSLVSTGITINSNGVHSHTINNQGGGSAHNNVPPYIALNYIIKF